MQTDPAARVLVLGASSLIGRRLPAAADGFGRALVGVSRSGPIASWRDMSWIVGDLTGAGLADRLPAADAALSLSPIWLLPSALPALAQAGVRRIVAFSSTSRVTKLDSPVEGERAVAAALAAGEDATRTFCEAAGIAWTLLRPTLIYSEGEDANISRLAGLIRRFGVLPLAGAGAGRRQPVHAADLAAAALQVIDRPETLGRIYDLPGGETLTYRAMAERIFEALGRRPRIVSVPPALWRLGLAAAAPALPGATAAMGSRMGEDLTFDPTPARRDFGWSPRAFRPDFRGL